MTRKFKYAMLLAAVAAGLPWANGIFADQAVCPTFSAGAETDAATGSVLNFGQAAIGRADNGIVFMQAGAMGCHAIQVFCNIGDVDGNGVIDGLDIDDYVRVYLTGVGTPLEICAANIDVAPFANLILAQ